MVIPLQRPTATAYRASLEPLIDVRDYAARLQARVSDSYFRSKRDTWVQTIGEPAGLEIYDPSPDDARRLLVAMQRIRQKFKSELLSTPLEEMLPHRRDALIKALLRILVAYGPLSSVRGVIDAGIGKPENEPFRAVDLDALALEVHAFAELFESVEERPRAEARRQLAAWMKKHSEKDVREMQVVVEVTADYGVRFEARPATLRALLWQVLFGRNDQSPGICRYCGAEFEQRTGPGRRRRFCLEHPESRHRMAVKAGTQPYKGNIVGDARWS